MAVDPGSPGAEAQYVTGGVGERAGVNGPFYDANQQDTVLRPCVQCGTVYHFRPWRTVCTDCDPNPHVAKVNP